MARQAFARGVQLYMEKVAPVGMIVGFAAGGAAGAYAGEKATDSELCTATRVMVLTPVGAVVGAAIGFYGLIYAPFFVVAKVVSMASHK